MNYGAGRPRGRAPRVAINHTGYALRLCATASPPWWRGPTAHPLPPAIAARRQPVPPLPVGRRSRSRRAMTIKSLSKWVYRSWWGDHNCHIPSTSRERADRATAAACTVLSARPASSMLWPPWIRTLIPMCCCCCSCLYMIGCCSVSSFAADCARFPALHRGRAALALAAAQACCALY